MMTAQEIIAYIGSAEKKRGELIGTLPAGLDRRTDCAAVSPIFALY